MTSDGDPVSHSDDTGGPASRRPTSHGVELPARWGILDAATCLDVGYGIGTVIQPGRPRTEVERRCPRQRTGDV